MLVNFNLLERIAQAFDDNKSQPYVSCDDVFVFCYYLFISLDLLQFSTRLYLAVRLILMVSVMWRSGNALSQINVVTLWWVW